MMAATKGTKKNRKHGARGLPRGPHGGVQLLLVQNVEHLGKAGDVVEVKRGYAVNYLIPQGLATIATEHHRRMVEKHKAKLLEIERARISSMKQLAENISQMSISIEANANEEGHLYGSVGAVEISRALKAQNVNISPEQVKLQGPLKELGLYTVQIHLGHDINADLKVWVVPMVGDTRPGGSR